MSTKSDLTRLVSQAFREAAKTPSLVSARVDSTDPALMSISTRWSVNNLATNTKVNSNQISVYEQIEIFNNYSRRHSTKMFY